MIKTVLYIHYPKCGGISLIESMKRALIGYTPVPYYIDDDPLCIENINSESIEQGRMLAREVMSKFNGKKLFVYGHCSPRSFVNEEIDYRFTMLRHPVDWFFSLYIYWSERSKLDKPAQLRKKDYQHIHKLYDWFLKEQPSLVDFVDHPKIRKCLSETFFGGYDINNLDFVGIQEQYSKSLQIIGKTIGVQLIEQRKNVTTKKEEYSQALRTKKNIRMIEDALKEDIKLYEKMVNRFW